MWSLDTNAPQDLYLAFEAALLRAYKVTVQCLQCLDALLSRASHTQSLQAICWQGQTAAQVREQSIL